MLATLTGLLLLVPLGSSPGLEVQVPANDGWVTDLAGMLSAGQEQQLELMMESYKQGSTHEIAVLTVKDMGGETVEGFALEVAREWGIGGAESSNGALLVVAAEERKLRIEVGRGLEGNLPDAICGRIIRDVITPAFRAGDPAGGIQRGVSAIHSAIGGDYAALEQSSRGRRGSGGRGGVITLGILFLILFMNRRRGGGSGGTGSLWPWLVLSSMTSNSRAGGFSHGGGGFGGGGGGGFSGFGGGGGFSGGGASGGW